MCRNTAPEAHESIDLPESVIDLLTGLRDYLQDKCEPPVYVSDRRFMKAINLLQVAAFADGRDEVRAFLVYCAHASYCIRTVLLKCGIGPAFLCTVGCPFSSHREASSQELDVIAFSALVHEGDGLQSMHVKCVFMLECADRSNDFSMDVDVHELKLTKLLPPGLGIRLFAAGACLWQ